MGETLPLLSCGAAFIRGWQSLPRAWSVSWPCTGLARRIANDGSASAKKLAGFPGLDFAQT